MGDAPYAPLAGRTIVLCITGGIAAYKAPLIVRSLASRGAHVDCILTEAAAQFVTPLSLQSLTGRPIYTRMFPVEHQRSYEIEHISLADKADLVLVAPATANCLARLAHGMADDLVTATVLATKAPVLLCPSMNVNMYEHPATRANLATLRNRGLEILEPEQGFLACGWEGKGRLPEPERIAAEVVRLTSPQDLAGLKILITCGPTCEDIDPVRFITNRSTGKMGAALVEAACLRGAEVTVISGPVALKYAPWARVVDVRSASEMLAAVKEGLDGVDVLIMAAAVADYVPKEYQRRKIKKGRSEMSALELRPSPDILATIKPLKDKRFFVGFAAETDDLKENALEKMKRKGLDMIVANRVGEEGSGFASATNSGILLSADGTQEVFEHVEKTMLAHTILDKIRGAW
ncbi:MAG TPA: bifunctional phosphopantothenoylcysteine decarboxylase/phosphopantothenate--cysteine ligase CoaBC [Deltaproteobacteria bacterium]|nr:bifunctional phosphopantothenoylcysteine decarboxylase/phosphopantothenate--cysteine ligase CoaBC [Deltaproteobacteria bacterium]